MERGGSGVGIKTHSDMTGWCIKNLIPIGAWVIANPPEPSKTLGVRTNN